MSAPLSLRLQHIQTLLGLAPQDAASKHAKALLDVLIYEAMHGKWAKADNRPTKQPAKNRGKQTKPQKQKN